MTRAAQIHSPVRAKPALLTESDWLAVGTGIASDNRPVYEEVPVIILNLFYTGLGIARDLAGCSMRVVGLSAHPKIFGNFTRLCEVRSAPNSQERPEALKEFLLQV